MDRWKITLHSLWFTQILSIMSFSLGMPFIIYYVQQLGTTDPAEVKVLAGIMSSGPAIAMAIMAPIWGKLADRFGKKPMVLRALFAGSIIMMGMGMATAAWQLVVLRIIQGVFTGTITASMALVASTVPENRMSYALGWMTSSTAIGNSIGPAIGGLLAEWVGYRYSFLLGGVILFLDVLVVLFLVQEPSRTRQHVRETLQESKRENPNQDQDHARKQNSRGFRLRDSFVLSGWFLTAMLLLLVIRFTTSIFSPYMPILVQMKQGGLEGAAVTTGIANAFICIMMAFSGMLLGKLGDRVDRMKLFRWFTAAACIVAIPLAWLGSLSTVWAVMIDYGIMMFFINGIDPVLMGVTTSRIGRTQRGTLFGVQAFVSSLGWGLSPLLGGALAIRFSPVAILAVIPMLLLLAFVLGCTAGRSLSGTATPVTRAPDLADGPTPCYDGQVKGE